VFALRGQHLLPLDDGALGDWFLAEGVRFELTGLLRPVGFQDRCNQPLCHPSVGVAFLLRGGFEPPPFVRDCGV
jgi:hypothetical protein